MARLPTLVVSDLHLGARSAVDVLRRPEALAALTDAIRADPPVDRLVVLGDALELRHGPPHEALAVAEPVFAALGEALGPGGELVLVAGNHDHAIVEPWLELRAAGGEPPLGLEQRADPAVSPLAARLAAAAAPARLELAYPGLWLRDDVYAMHGHYLDLHVTVPVVERLAAGLMTRLVGAVPATAARPEHYEAPLSPLYAWNHAVARYTQTGAGEFRQVGSAKAWRRLTGGGRRRSPRALALVGGFGVAVAILRRLVGPLSTDLSPAELRRAGLAAMHETTRRLGIDAAHVVFGHTHRTGPLPDDDPSSWGGLVNTGCWVAEPVFVAGAQQRSPYWAGSAVRVDDDGSPPRRFNLLGGTARGSR